MQISGNLLPAPYSSNNQELFDKRQPFSDRQIDSERRNRQQTVEYVFQAEILEEVAYQQQTQNPYTQTIDPANQSAISSYAESASIAPGQGRLVDIFI